MKHGRKYVPLEEREHCAECDVDVALQKVFGLLRCEHHARLATFDTHQMADGEDCVSAMERTR